MTERIADNYIYVRARHGGSLAGASGRDASGVTLVAVTKTVEPGLIEAGIAAGMEGPGGEPVPRRSYGKRN